MGLENINFSAAIPLTQNTEGAGAASGEAQRNPLLFLQQLLTQLQNLTGGQQEALPEDLQAMLKNGPEDEQSAGQSAMDALKAALAALQAGKGPDGGKNLPTDGAAPGAELPEGMAALLSEAGDNAASLKGGKLTAQDKQRHLTPLLAADGQALPMPVMPPPALIEPPPLQERGVSLPFGLSAKPADEGADTVGAQGHGGAPAQMPQPAALMAELQAPAAKRAQAPLGADGVADLGHEADALAGAGKQEGFANTLAAVTAGGSINLAAAPDARSGAPATPPAVATPLGHPGWNQEFGDRIVWMTGKSLDSASIHLNPPHLGPVEVRISMNHEQQASIQFVSEHAAVREAIEAAVPRLREMMGGQQVTLADVNVSNQSAQQQSAQRDESRAQNSPQPAANMPRQELEVDESLLADAPRVIRTSNGVLSLYA